MSVLQGALHFLLMIVQERQHPSPPLTVHLLVTYILVHSLLVKKEKYLILLRIDVEVTGKAIKTLKLRGFKSMNEVHAQVDMVREKKALQETKQVI
jgi:hypothetical protein